MGTTSLVHQGVHISFRFDNLRSRVWSLPAFVYRTPVALKQVPVRASLPCTSLHHVSSGSYPYGRFLPIPCARQTEQEDFFCFRCAVAQRHRVDRVRGFGLIPIDHDLKETEKRTSSEKLDSTQSFPFVGNPNKIGEEFGHDNLSPVRTVALWVCAAVAFGVVLGFKDGIGKASEFFAGYLLEQSLSVDNLFVFVLIFKYFQVPLMYQSRVLSYGIAGAVFFRASLILLGTATLQLFAREEEETDLSNNFVVMTCRRFIPVTTNYDKGQFITIQDGVRKATPLLLTLAVIELSDIAFAVDSIPAVFGITRDPFIVFSSNLFAILGLRSLYTLISGSMSELEYLQPAIGVVLGFIGCKMILDFFGYHVSTEVSLGCVAASLSAGVLLSLMKNSDSKS